MKLIKYPDNSISLTSRHSHCRLGSLAGITVDQQVDFPNPQYLLEVGDSVS